MINIDWIFNCYIQCRLASKIVVKLRGFSLKEDYCSLNAKVILCLRQNRLIDAQDETIYWRFNRIINT